jgi:hypothetical protein
VNETDAQLERRRNREQWYALVYHLLSLGYSVRNIDGANTLFTPDGNPVMTLPDDFKA